VALNGWTTAIASLILVVWLIPIKSYRLPVTLPFQLEVYRLLLILLVCAWLLAGVFGSGRFDLGGQTGAPLLLAAAALLAMFSNTQAIKDAGQQTQAIKSLSYFLSFLIAYALIASNVRTLGEIKALVTAFVLGGTIVAVFALIESRTYYNVFGALDKWIPFLVHEGGSHAKERGARLRVRASAQHPIALAAALLMCVPFALYLARYAVTRARARLWVIAAVLTATGAMATVSRTAVLVVIAMVVVGLWVRPREVKRMWPLLPVGLVIIHLALPGAMGTLYRTVFPKQGLTTQLSARGGQHGSGRLADIGPGLDRWKKAPLFGHGLGTQPSTADREAAAPTTLVGPSLIFDDQYLNTLVTLGLVGLIGVVWFTWGNVRRLGRAARRRAGPDGDLIAATCVACAGFGVGMFTFDAFSFVQATLFFFVIAALGSRVRQLTGL
jgi:hypothetical protein